MQKEILVVGLSALAALGVLFITYFTYSNAEVRLREQVDAQVLVLESHHDKMWRTLQQQADVSSEYREAFTEIYPALIEGRYEGRDVAAALNINVVQEDNPNFDTSLYQELSRTIEAERTSFHRAQSRLVDLQREHRTLLRTFPGSLILAGVEEVDVTIVSNTRTKEVMATGIDDNIDLF